MGFSYCLLYSAVDPPQVEGWEVKSRYRKLFRAKDYDFTLEFDFSPYLVKFNSEHDSGSKVLQLDEISATSDNWSDADVMALVGAFREVQNNGSYATLYPHSLVDIVQDTIRKMRTPVKYLNITKLSQYRRDVHPGLYMNSRWKVVMERYKRHIPSFVDCSHWCLPGVPDTWNRLLYASLFSNTV
ncbi:hypothetical protein Cgig2_014498 [Carnegiea gigantea]|uniref:Trichome birefringence-like C-terminal domain-containing protein n=1 Tax=Carnegiea gigantea TaxID=171969 RepID=A0A9Q1JZ38_9CARY|nr:hypothetical protein Cgig2_014498 [Carnegiea gigantea]